MKSSVGIAKDICYNKQGCKFRCFGNIRLKCYSNTRFHVIRKRREQSTRKEKSMLEAGIKGYQEMIVSKRDTAKVHGSGTLDVLATPRMIALVEETAWKSIAEHLEPGMGSVGIRVDIRHLAATPVGMKVWCETVVSEVEGRKLSFHAAVYDEAGKIGEGAHERFLVDEVKFQEKAELKARNA
jgi:predicted thioesterase